MKIVTLVTLIILPHTGEILTRMEGAGRELQTRDIGATV